jgi:hypothetical protein
MTARLLTRRPTEGPTAQDVQVNVKHRLARTCVDVEDGPITFLMDIRLHCHSLCNLKHVADQSVVVGR